MSRSKIIVDQNRGNNPFPPKKNLVSSRAMTNFNMDNKYSMQNFLLDEPNHSTAQQTSAKGKRDCTEQQEEG